MGNAVVGVGFAHLQDREGQTKSTFVGKENYEILRKLSTW